MRDFGKTYTTAGLQAEDAESAGDDLELGLCSMRSLIHTQTEQKANLLVLGRDTLEDLKAVEGLSTLGDLVVDHSAECAPEDTAG